VCGAERAARGHPRQPEAATARRGAEAEQEHAERAERIGGGAAEDPGEAVAPVRVPDEVHRRERRARARDLRAASGPDAIPARREGDARGRGEEAHRAAAPGEPGRARGELGGEERRRARGCGHGESPRAGRRRLARAHARRERERSDDEPHSGAHARRARADAEQPAHHERHADQAARQRQCDRARAPRGRGGVKVRAQATSGPPRKPSGRDGGPAACRSRSIGGLREDGTPWPRARR